MHTGLQLRVSCANVFWQDNLLWIHYCANNTHPVSSDWLSEAPQGETEEQSLVWMHSKSSEPQLPGGFPENSAEKLPEHLQWLANVI